MPAKDYNAYMASYMLARYRTRKDEALALLGGKCVTCGVTENLEFDHIERKNKSFTLTSMWSIAKAKFLAELNKCQLLCRSCHSKKTDSETSKSLHGTENRYLKYKCRCLRCKANMSRLKKIRRGSVG